MTEPTDASTAPAGAPRAAVLGSPIAHSKSPLLHAAAAQRLGVARDYRAFDVGEDGLAAFLEGRGPGWRGCSITMPLKSAVIPLCRSISPVARLTGAVNTIVFDGPAADAPFDGDNTDVEGVRLALDEAGAGAERVELLGAGNTASSVIVACAQRGARHLTLRVRSEARARDAVELATGLGLEVRVEPLDAVVDEESEIDLVVNTIPGGREVRVAYPEAIRRTATLFDVIYDPWPTALATEWLEVGGTIVSGLEMLLHQAVGQVRRFTIPEDGARDVGDGELIAAMRAALD